MTRKKPAPKGRRAQAETVVPFEEVPFRSHNAYLTVLINRVASRIRIIDFRAGAMPAKRLFIQSIAQREGVEKVQIFVEKDEISAWSKVGFVREATIPGFYKRSDGYLCGFVTDDRSMKQLVDKAAKDAEKALNQSKKADLDPAGLKTPTIRTIDADKAKALRTKFADTPRSYAAFEPFARDADYLFFTAGAKASQPDQILGVEFEECFGHAQLSWLYEPDAEKTLGATQAALNACIDNLATKHIVSVYALAAIDGGEMLSLLLANGFKKTGVVPMGLRRNDGTDVDAVLMSRKLDFLDDD